MAFDYSIIRDRKFYDVVTKPLKFGFKLFLRVKCVGKENIPENGAFIIAANHINVLDPVIIISECKRPIHFMAKAEAFKNKVAAWFLTHLNVFPVNRGRNDKTSVDYAVKLIENGHVLGIFPEGTRSKDLKPQKAKAGVALIAKQTEADILPVSMYCEKKKGFLREITVRFGELIKYEELGLDGECSTRELRDAAEKVMGEIVSLWEEGHCK